MGQVVVSDLPLVATKRIDKGVLCLDLSSPMQMSTVYPSSSSGGHWRHALSSALNPAASRCSARKKNQLPDNNVNQHQGPVTDSLIEGEADGVAIKENKNTS